MSTVADPLHQPESTLLSELAKLFSKDNTFLNTRNRLQAVVYIKATFHSHQRLRTEVLCIIQRCFSQCILCDCKRTWGTQNMCMHPTLNHILAHITLRPPQKPQKISLGNRDSDLVEHTLYAMKATLSWRKRTSTPTKLLLRSGPGNNLSFNETPANLAEASRTTLSLFFRGCITPWCGRYHRNPSPRCTSSTETSLAWPFTKRSSTKLTYFLLKISLALNFFSKLVILCNASGRLLVKGTELSRKGKQIS